MAMKTADGIRGVHHAEIDEPEQAGRDNVDQAHPPAPDAVGDVARERDGDERNAGRHHHRGDFENL